MAVALPAVAAIVPPECATGLATVEACGLASLIGVFVRVAQFIFGIAGSIALAMFVYGGFVWLTSAGSPEKIQKGKTVLIQTVVALAIIFGAYTGVQFLTGALLGGESKVQIEGQTCVGANKAQGTTFRLANGDLKCVTRCEDLADEGYSKSNVATGQDCIPGLFPNEPREIQCCRGGAAGEAAGAGAAGELGDCKCGFDVSLNILETVAAAAAGIDESMVCSRAGSVLRTAANWNDDDEICTLRTSAADCAGLRDRVLTTMFPGGREIDLPDPLGTLEPDEVTVQCRFSAGNQQ